MFNDPKEAGAILTSAAIRLGVMVPLTGLVEIYGREISLAAQIACSEVNESGGVLGRPLELIFADDGSLPESAVAAAEQLVAQQGCAALVGNLLSNSRIAVAYRVAEPRKIPYLNFSFYEGSISSRYFFHFAALPNQQIDQMIPWMLERHGPKMFFAGHNYEWPRGSIDAAKRILELSGGQVVGEEYYPLGIGPDDLGRLLDNLAASGAEVFVPYFAGIDQVHLLAAFAARGLKKRMAVVMGHYDEVMASLLAPEVREGFYSSNTYFMGVDTPENQRYLERLGARPDVTGIWPQGNGVLTNFGEGTYLCVKAFALAANQAGSSEAEALVTALETISLRSPQGPVRMDPRTHHATVNTYLACCQADGAFKIIEHFGAIAPQLPERYRYLPMSGHTHVDEDIRLQARMLEQMTEAIFLVDAGDGTIVYTNPGSERMFGYDPGELTGKRVANLNAPADKAPEEIAAEINAILYRKGVWRGEIRNLKKDGASFWSAVSISAFTHSRYGEVWLSVYKDISERKQAEEEIAWNLALNQALSSLYMPLVTAAADIEQIAHIILEKSRQLTGSAHGFVAEIDPVSKEFIGHTLTRMMQTECKVVEEEARKIRFPRGADGLYRGLWGHALNTREPFYTNEAVTHPARTGIPAGHIAIDRFLAVPVLLSGELVGQIALANSAMPYTARDLKAIERIGEFYALAIQQQRVEAALLSASRYTRSLIEASLDPLVTISPAGKIMDVNQATELATGVAREQLIGSDFCDYFTQPEQARAGYRLVLEQGQVKDYPLSLRHLSGRVMDVLYNAAVYKNAAGELQGVFAVARDVTSLRRTQEELNRMNRELEERVQARTTELAEKNLELEKFNKLFVGRELRMIELKERIRQLDKQEQ